MPIHKIEVDSQEIRIWQDVNTLQVFEIAGVMLPDNQEKADSIALFIQENWFDVRESLNSLSPSHPDRVTDPGLPWYFWDGDGVPSTTELVSRAILFTLEWDGIEYIPTIQQIIPE